MSRLITAALCVGLALAGARPALGDAPPPIAAFARQPALSDVVISPDGRRIAYLTGVRGLPALAVYELGSGHSPALVLGSVPNEALLSWCGFKTPVRLLCSYRSARGRLGQYGWATRLVVVDADGRNRRVLLERTDFNGSGARDRIVDWQASKPNTVLIEVWDPEAEAWSVFELNINRGTLARQTRGQAPMTSFIVDRRGDARIGCGLFDTTMRCFARDSGSAQWRKLVKFEVFEEGARDAFTPLGFAADPNIVYVQARFEGRDALWQTDLRDVKNPELEFTHPAVDIDAVITARDGHLLAVRYETDQPQVHYLDADFKAQMLGIERAVGGGFSTVVSSSNDDKLLVIERRSDVDAGSYFIFDKDAQHLTDIGRQYPELVPASLGRMQPISYAARDGTSIPGYLTLPPGVAAKHVPLIVMPHGGPISRDRWEFDFLRLFLASRGYAVLQMNYRGSSGYGERWFYAAHEDWGGVTYSDIDDAAHWAVSSGIADPERMAIVGWGFGGYAALLAAVRDGQRYRCAVSIAGFSDLRRWSAEHDSFGRFKYVETLVGTDSAKLKAASPARHADTAATPILMVHGTKDAQASVNESNHMDAALARAKKPHELVLLDGESHQIDSEPGRTRLLEVVERFLKENLGPGVLSPPT